MNTMDRLAAALAKPMTHVVITEYNGREPRRHETRSEAAAQNYAEREARKVGSDLIDRESGKTVHVRGVRVEAL